jgi:PadR family transcriptional regulator PadR
LIGAATPYILSHTLSMGSIAKKTELLPGTLEMLILKTLERNAEQMHGYAVARFIKQISGDVLQVEEGSLYPALQCLALKGWVKSEWGLSARYYKLTPAGKKRLKQEVADFERVLEAILRVVQPALSQYP